MIGAGVFTTSGFALSDLGEPSFVLLAWAVGGVIALCGALSYAALAECMPGNGGEYLFLSRALHPLAGFLAGWVSLLAGFTAPIAVAAHSLEAYVSSSLGFEIPRGVLGASAIALCGLGHGATRSLGLRVQDIAVAVKLFAIVLFVAIGGWILLAGDSGSSLEVLAQTPTSFSVPAFAVTLVWVSFAYSGWNAAVYVAGELEDPNRTLRLALVASTVGVTALYLALNAVFLWSAPVSELSGHAEIGAIAAEALGGPLARTALTTVVSLGLLTSISAMVMVGPRVYAQMAADGYFPSRLATGSAEPKGAIALQVGLALIAFFVSELRELLLYVGFLLSLSAAMTVACLFLPKIRQERAGQRRFGDLWIAMLFIASTLWSAGFLVLREPTQAAVGLGTVVAGLALYFAMKRTLHVE